MMAYNVGESDKTDDGEWITSYECDPSIADQEFLFSKRQYAALTGREPKDSDVIAYHLRQSFKPGEIDPAKANQIGYDLAMSLTKGNHAFIVCTHVDKNHTHSHIIFNSTSLDCTHKFRNFWRSSFAVRRISDLLCLENGLSVIENPKPSRGSYGTWLGDSKPPSVRAQLEQLIDAALDTGCKDFDSFLAAMKTAGARFDFLTDKIKVTDKRMKDIAELQKHIGAYTKTREIYMQYRKLPTKKAARFYEEHSGEILSCQSEKRYFDSIGMKKLPPMHSLKQEYATLLAENKKLYPEFKQTRAKMIELMTAKNNVDRILGLSSEQEKLRSRQREDGR